MAFLNEFKLRLETFLSLLQSFNEILNKEKTCLQKHHIETLNEVLSQKNQIIANLNECANQLQHLFSSHQMILSEDVINGLLQHLDDPERAAYCTLMRDIKTLIKDCEYHNLVNGITIVTLLNYNQQVLHLLTNKGFQFIYNQNAKILDTGFSTKEIKI